MRTIQLILALSVCLSSGTAGAEEVVSGDLGRRLDALLKTNEAQGFSGVLLVSRQGEIAISKGYGLADRENGVRCTSETVFDIGSVTKQFTAAGIMHLEQAGKLAVQDKIGKYFSNVPDDKAGITLHHLLTHSSGLREGFGHDYEVMTRDQIVRAALESELSWEPGDRYRYSNAGYSLLGAIIEIVSGKPYEQYLRDNLFAPAVMTQTGYVLPDWDKDLIAHGYRRDDTHWKTPLDHKWDKDGPYWNLKSNGGILSTVGDLYRWHRALARDEIFDEERKQKIFTPYMREGPTAKSYYGYGWAIFNTRQGKKIAHDGGNGVFFADFIRYVDKDIVFIILSNTSPHSGAKYEREVLRSIFFPPE